MIDAHPFACNGSQARPTTEEKPMKICPIAIVSGCAKCPVVGVCPLKSVIGDYVKPEEKKAAENSAGKKKS
jgi:hypothetical protein